MRPGSAGREPSSARRSRSACGRASRRITSTRSTSPPRRRRTSTGRSATTRCGRSSITSRGGCAHPRGLDSLRRGQRALRRHDRGALRARLARLGARLPPHARPGDVRAREPRLSIGVFLHIPFPSSEVYRLLPAREQLLRGVLGADYVSFQVGDYARHFRSSCLRMLGIDSEPDWLESTEGGSASASIRSGSTWMASAR